MEATGYRRYDIHMTWLGLVWLCLAIYALAMLVFTLMWLFFKVRGAYRALRDIEMPESEGIAESTVPVARAPGATGNAETLTAARLLHQEIKQQRRANKQRRLHRAQTRWASYGLVDAPR